jgi:hypothetical protein
MLLLLIPPSNPLSVYPIDSKNFEVVAFTEVLESAKLAEIVPVLYNGTITSTNYESIQ